MHVWVGGRKIQLDPSRSVGKGGEADVFEIGGDRALKLFKSPDHPDLAGQPQEQEAARRRLAEHQRKLQEFPTRLPPRVVRPEALVTGRDGSPVLGYTMRLVQGAEVLLRYGDRSFRQAGVGADTVVRIFRDLHATVAGVHSAGVVIGDFNDLNVLVLADEAYLIDADSFQFGPFPCRVFSERFVDPLLCDASAARPILAQPHTEASDWYAYGVMLMRSLLYVDPYGGIYKPTDTSQRIPPGARPLRRITVFHPDVRYPRPAERWDILPDDLLHHFHRLFEKDARGEFPLALLEGLRFTRCTQCGVEHARGSCPACLGAPLAAVREATTVRGAARSTRIMRTRGAILLATVEDGELRYLVLEDGVVKREDGAVVLAGEPGPRTRFRISGKRTLVGRDGALVTLVPGVAPSRTAVDDHDGLPTFDANTQGAYWVEGGRLMREGRLGPERIGDVLARQTRFWVGPDFGLGFYRAGDLQVAFVFDAHGRGLNDSVRLPSFRGQLEDATCVFGRDRAWLLTSARDGGRTVNRCAVVRPDGGLEAFAEAASGDGSWLAQIRGRCAAGPFLLAATDDGIVRVEAEGGRLVKAREFPDTEPFVDAGCALLAARDGLYVVDRQEIRLLRLA